MEVSGKGGDGYHHFHTYVRRPARIPNASLAAIYANAAAWLESNPGYDTHVAISKATDHFSDKVASVASSLFLETCGAWIGNDEGVMMLCFASALASTGDL